MGSAEYSEAEAQEAATRLRGKYQEVHKIILDDRKLNVIKIAEP